MKSISREREQGSNYVLKSLVGLGEEFFHNYYDEKPISFVSVFEKPLLSTDDLDDFISSRVLRSPTDLRVCRNGSAIDLNSYSNPVNTSNASMGHSQERILAPESLDGLLNKGCTLVFQGLHHHLSQMMDFCNRLSLDLKSQVGANAYLSPPHAIGGNHFDYHDVFILQLEGEKSWTICRPQVLSPNEKTATQADTPGEVVLECTLNAGSGLYLPKGYWHCCETGDSTSLHLTLSTANYTSSEWLSAAINQFINEDPYRISISKLLCCQQFEELTAIKDRIAADLNYWLDKIITQHTNTTKKKLPNKSPGLLKQSSKSIEVLEESKLKAVNPYRWTINYQADQIDLQSGINIISCPRIMQASVDKLIENGILNVRELLPLSDTKVCLAMARELIRRNFVMIME
ncbi:MAG: cupin domain-containing protein [Pseudomonadales bacterium]|nr:cupin domain-containing protein [Pseudomonadales bacterium]